MCEASKDWTERLSKSNRLVKSSINMQPSDHRSTFGVYAWPSTTCANARCTESAVHRGEVHGVGVHFGRVSDVRHRCIDESAPSIREGARELVPCGWCVV